MPARAVLVGYPVTGAAPFVVPRDSDRDLRLGALVAGLDPAPRALQRITRYQKGALCRGKVGESAAEIS